MRRKSESTSAAKREAHDRADAAMPDVAGLTVKQAEMALAEARNRERARREYMIMIFRHVFFLIFIVRFCLILYIFQDRIYF